MMRLASGSGAGGNLTGREVEILRLLARGSRIQEIADELYLSTKTVKNHLTNVYAKLGVETAAQAVAEAYRTGIVSTP
jgi:DNA-binding NarL/FixJ family response regulator